VSSVSQVTALMSEIATASAQQSSGIEQVSEAISQMDDVTQQNAALVEQAAAAAESLQGQAESLFSAVSRYRVGNESSRTPQPASRGTAAGASKVAKARGASGAPETDWEEF
jgi:methyl-accepting chemotaxis protein